MSTPIDAGYQNLPFKGLYRVSDVARLELNCTIECIKRRILLGLLLVPLFSGFQSVYLDCFWIYLESLLVGVFAFLVVDYVDCPLLYDRV